MLPPLAHLDADLTPGNILLKADPATNSVVVKLAVSGACGPTGRDTAARAECVTIERQGSCATISLPPAVNSCLRRTLVCLSSWTPRPRTCLALAVARPFSWRQRCVCVLADGRSKLVVAQGARQVPYC